MANKDKAPVAAGAQGVGRGADGAYSPEEYNRVALTGQLLTAAAELWGVDARTMIDAFREAAELELERQRIAADAALRALERGASDD